MSDRTFEIHFDDGKDTFTAGENISGHVSVTAPKKTKVNEIALELSNFTHGRGNRNKECGHRTVISGKEIVNPHVTKEFPFSLRAPEGPKSYDGQCISLAWAISAQMDVSWAIDPRAERLFVLADPAKLRLQTPPDGKRRKWSLFSKLIFLLCVACALGTVGFVAWRFILHARENLGPPWNNLAPLIVAVPFLLIGVVVVLIRHTKSLFQDLGVSFKENDVESELNAYDVRVWFVPRKDMKLNGTKFTIFARETAISGSGTKETTHRRTVFEKAEFLPGKSLRAGLDAQFETRITLPSTGMPPFLNRRYNRIEYFLSVDFDIAGWPDYRQVRALQAATSTPQ